MQGKGLINFIVILVTLACLYSLSFTFVTRSVERDAATYANGDLAKEKAYLDSIAGEDVLNLGFAKYTYRECKQREISLGLDLKGGMNVTMEISLQDLIRNLAANPEDSKFEEVLKSTDARTKQSQKDFVTLLGEEVKKVYPNTSLARFFATKDNAATLNANSTDAQVLNFLQNEAGSAIEAPRRAKYGAQVELYATAVERITGEAVAGRTLLFTADAAVETW